MDSLRTPAGGDHLRTAISIFQAAAVADPYRPIGEIVDAETPSGGCPATNCPNRHAGCAAIQSDCRCSFQDFDRLFEQLAKPAIMELAKPLPTQRRLTKRRVGSNPAAHNRALLGDPRSSGEGARAAG